MATLHDVLGVTMQANETWTETATFLARPEHFGGTEPSAIETHISKVFLGGDRVLKLKKPVRYDFLDYSTVGRRRWACAREVELNRRLAPDTYLGFHPITRRHDGTLELGGNGDAVDWVVEMRRLPAEKMLDRMIAAREASVLDTQRLASTLAPFYARARRIYLPPGAMAGRYARNVRGNLRELIRSSHGLSETQVRRIHGRQLQFLALNSHVFDQRVTAGKVIDGHGDLRPEHVCMVSDPIVFDCVEFNDDLREIDVVDELGFFAMECEALGAPTIGRTLLAACEAALGDAPPRDLVAFYESYRACVRAKVAALKAQQGPDTRSAEPDQRTLRYLTLADRSLGWSGAPVCIVMRGVAGSGKSTIASLLAEHLGAAHLKTDAIRRDLFGSGPGDAAYDEGRYRQENRQAVYNELIARGRQLLEQGCSVALDGAFLTADLLKRATAAALDANATAFLIRCDCSADVAMKRIAARKLGLSEARPEHVASQQAVLLSEPEPPHAASFHFDASGSSAPTEVPAGIIDALRKAHRHPSPAAGGRP